MDEQRLAEIEARANAATAGPWHAGYWQGQCHVAHRHDGAHCHYEYTLDTSQYWNRCIAVEQSYMLLGDAELSPEDARFVAHAREDIPALVAEVRRLQALLRRPD